MNTSISTNLRIGRIELTEEFLKELIVAKDLLYYIVQTHPELRDIATAAKVIDRLEKHDGHHNTGL